ncbi:unnamed protein product [Chrysodeixis includens]|uniref:Gustatory receptor n=1 Tax=Chrysodeixis includens TaxID=689277 RepID=A0A9P0C527_CHRIL|nr:unnamed protein product [Chrysodeixis includens]
MNLLRILVFVENVVGIYRNYLYFKTYQKVLIIIRIFLEVFLSIAIASHNVALSFFTSFETGEDVRISGLFQAIILMKVLVLSIGPLRSAKSYKLYLEDVKIIYNRFKDVPSYAKSLKMLKLKCCLVTVIFVISSGALTIIRINNLLYWKNHNIINFMVQECYETFVDFRYIFEQFVAYSAITGIYDSLKLINESVLGVLDQCSKKGNGQICDEDDKICHDLLKEVNSWMEFYRYVMSCTKYLSRCFNELVNI